MKSLDYLSSIHTEKTTFSFRLIRLSVQKGTYSDLSELFILFVEYAQLLAQTLLATFYLYSDTTLDSQRLQFKHLLSPLSKGFDLSYLVGYGEYNSSVMIATSVVALTAFSLIMGMLIYILVLAFTKQQGGKILVGIWKRTFNINMRISSFYIASYLAGIFKLNQNRILDMDAGVKYLIYVCFWGAFVFLYLTAIILTKYCTCVLPTKNLFASKSATLGIFIQVQKLIMFLLFAFLQDNPSVNRWVYPIIGLLFDLLRLEYFFRVLPFYKSRALFIQATFLVIPFALNIACFAQAILQASNYSPNMNFLIISWIILSIIGARVVQNYLKNMLLQTIINPKGHRSEILSHRVYLINELRRTNGENNYLDSETNWPKLLKTTININPESLFAIDCNLTKLFESKQAKNELYLKYLHALLTRFPKKNLLKLFLAYFYAKKQKKYAIALKLLDELQTSSSYIIRCNAALLVENVQEGLRKEYEHSDSKLDLFSYNKNILLVVELKKNIMKQCNLQINLYKEMNHSSPNLATLFNLAQEVHRCRGKSSKNMKIIEETAPEYYLEPLALCAYYHLVSNHMIPEYLEYMRLFTHRYHKYEKVLKGSDLCKENLYSKDVGIALVSGVRDKTGMVMYANRQFKNACGKNPVHEGAHNFASPFLQPFWKQLPKTFAAYQGVLTPNPIRIMYLYNASGYITPGGSFLNIHPYIWKGQHYIYVFRPMPNPKEHIILSKNGGIQTFTEKIAKKLGLIPPTQPNSSSGIPIRQLSHELDEISRAYDLTTECAEGKIEENEEVIKARELFTQYSTTGGVLQIGKLKQNSEENGEGDSEVYEFHCRIEVGGRSNILSKVVILEEIETKKRGSNELLEILEKVPEKKISENVDTLTEEGIPSEGKSPLRINMDFIMTPKGRGIRETSPFRFDSQTDLLTPKSPVQFLTQTLETEAFVTSTKQLVPNKTLVTQNEDNLSPKRSALSSKKQVDQKYSISDNKGKNVDADIDAQSVNSQKSGSSNQISKMKAFHELLAANLSPKKYRIFILLLLGLIISLLVFEGLMKFGLDKYITNLKSRKDVFSKARMRNIRLMDIHRNTRYLWLMDTSLINEAGTDADIASIAAGVVSRLGGYVKQLTDADRNLRNAVNSLDEETTKTMFQNNVKIYYSNYNDTQQTYITLNTFDATSDIVSAVLQMMKFIKTNSVNTLSSLNFIARNIINDILVQTQSVVNLLLTMLQDDRIKSQNFTLIITLIPSLLLVILIIVFLYLIREFYLKEKHTMAAFALLNLREIATVHERISRFTQMIEDETSFEDVPSVNISEFLYRKDTRNKLSTNKAKDTSNYKGIRTKYILTTIKLLAFMLCLLGVIEANLGVSFSVINSLGTKVHQVQVTSAMAEQVTLLASILIEMVSVNDTTKVLDATPSVLALNTLDQISTLKAQILDIYQTSSSAQAAILKPILFSNLCAVLPNTAVRYYCALMAKDQNTTGFIQMTTYVEFFFTETRAEFLASNRSSDILYQYQANAFNEQVVEIAAIQDMAFLIWNATNNDLDDNIQKRQNQNTISFAMLMVLLVVIAVFVDRVILQRLRDTDNQLRRVLMTVPGNLILSNFILKSYLLKIAEGRLDFIRNEI